ncbi:MAG: RdgB/HAM1 family non-canonical purine NTP pyrophosphatase [Acidimicrobiia bacterium]
MTIPRLVIATKNEGKIVEISALLASLNLADEIVGGLEWPEVEETGDTLEANAILKAEAVVEATGLPALADDTGLEVAALSGRPGVHSARYAGPDATFDDNIAKLLDELEGASDRSARFVTVVALAFPDGANVTASGSMKGRIAEQRRGARGFGYDPVFEVDGLTLSEMGQEAKNRLSHRALALRELVRTLGI